MLLPKTSYCLYLLVAITLYEAPASCQHVSDVQKLIKDKETNYDKSVRPVTNQSKPITIYLSFELLSITDVDEVQQTIKINALFTMVWVDELMSWNPADYGSVDQITVDSDRFWTPTLILSNTNENFEKAFNPWISVRYTSSGMAFYFPGIVFKVMCQLDIRFYPWDRHACLLTFTPWGYSPLEYDIRNTTSKVGTTYYYPNGAWDLVGSHVETEVIQDLSNYYSVIIIIQRQSAYVIVNVILPVIILSLLNLMIYFIPTESGERLSFSITLLLAIAVFLTIVGDNLPKSSTPMALFSFYLLSVLVISNCITLSVIYSLCLYHRDDSKPIGGCWKRIVRVMKCKCNSRKRNDKYRNDLKKTDLKEDSEIEINNRSYNTPVSSTSISHIRPFHWTTHQRNIPVWPPNNGVAVANEPAVDNEVKGDDDDDEHNVNWKTVSVAFDRMCFVFFLLALIAATCTTFGLIYVGLKEPNDDSIIRDELRDVD